MLRGIFKLNHKIVFFLLVFNIAFTVSALTPTIPQRAYSLGASEIEIGILGFLISAAYTVFPFVFSIFVDLIGKIRLIQGGLISYIILIVLYSIVDNVQRMLVLRFLEGVIIAAVWPTLDALAHDISQEMKSERGLSLFSTSWSLGYALGPLTLGQMIDAYGFTMSLSLLLMTMLISLFLCLSLKYKEKATEKMKFREVIKLMGTKDYFFHVILPAFVLGYDIGVLFNVFPAYAASLNISPSTIGALFLAFMGVRVLFFGLTSVPRSILGLISWKFTGLILLGFSFFCLSEVFVVDLWYPIFCIIGIAASLLYLSLIHISEPTRPY